MKSQKIRSNFIKICDRLIFKILVLERGLVCEICGGRAGIGTFHIMSKKKCPRLRYHKRNLLLAGWFCCHSPWHHDFDAKERIDAKIKQLRGEDYREEFIKMDIASEKLSVGRLGLMKEILQIELKSLEDNN